MTLENKLEHAHCIEHLFFKMLQDNMLTYVHPSNCPYHNQEIDAIPSITKQQKNNDKGQVWEVESYTLPDAKLHGKDLRYCVHLVECAYKRRGMAMDVVGLMSYEEHEELREALMNPWSDDELSEGLVPISFDEMINIDKKIWRKFNQLCKSGIGPDSSGHRPLDTAWKTIKNDIEIRLMLAPKKALERSQSSASGVPPPPQPTGQRSPKTEAYELKELVQRRKLRQWRMN